MRTAEPYILFSNYRTVGRIIKKFKAAELNLEESQVYYENLTAAAQPALIVEWKKQAQEAEKDRVSRPEVMDFLRPQMSTGTESISEIALG